MGGLARICKLYGSMRVKDSKGNNVLWIHDYVSDKPRVKSEMTKEEISESEKIKWTEIQKRLKSKD